MVSPAAHSTDRQATVDKSGSRVRRMFGEIAGRYDLLNRVLSLGVDIYWRWRTVRTVPPNSSQPVLDVCTGTGDLALAYRKKTDPQIPVIGTDFTHEMLVLADQKSRRGKLLGETTFLEADTQALPFPDGMFQIVSVAFGLRNVSDTRQGLIEMTRVCAPGGQVAVLEFSRPRSRLFGAVYRLYFQHLLPRIGQWVSGSNLDAYSYLPQSVGEFPDGQALAAIMEECGLRQVRYRPMTWGIATLYYGMKPAADKSSE